MLFARRNPHDPAHQAVPLAALIGKEPFAKRAGFWPDPAGLGQDVLRLPGRVVDPFVFRKFDMTLATAPRVAAKQRELFGMKNLNLEIRDPDGTPGCRW